MKRSEPIQCSGEEKKSEEEKRFSYRGANQSRIYRLTKKSLIPLNLPKIGSGSPLSQADKKLTDGIPFFDNFGKSLQTSNSSSP